MIKNIFYALLLIAVFAAGYFISQKLSFPHHTTENAQVLLEQVKRACKLTTVEGYFSEIYDYKDYWGYDFSPFRKKALVRVKAKVAVGFDLSKAEFKTDNATKTIIINNLPDPEILSIDHSMDYYDISEGTFNYFKTEDYNKIQQNVKDFIRQQVEKSELKQKALQEKDEILQSIGGMIEAAGWRLDVRQGDKSITNQTNK